MKTRAHDIAASVLLVALSGAAYACSSDGGSSSGSSGSSTNPFGTDPTGPSGSGGSSGAPAPPGSGTAASSSSGSSGAGPAVYCNAGDGLSCLCGHNADYGLATTTCSASSYASPSLCCGPADWPAEGVCACVELHCNQDEPDICMCGAATKDDKNPVPSCAKPPSGVCCKTSGAFGTQLCACFTDLKQCPSDQVEVSSCDAGSLSCQGGAVPRSSEA